MDGERVLLDAFARRHPARLAQALSRDGGTLGVLSDDAAAQVARHLPTTDAARALAGTGRAGPVLDGVPARVAAAILRKMPDPDAVLGAMLPRRRAEVAALLRYPDHTVGAVMDADVLSTTADCTAGEVLARARTQAARALYTVYVVTVDNRLEGVLTLGELMRAPEAAHVRDLMSRDPTVLTARVLLSEAMDHPAWRRLRALPVVDNDVFVGALRHAVLVELERARAAHVGSAAALGELFGLGVAALGSAVGSLGGGERR